tara:strand:- start:15181 stop:15576 length:396 start_codon:yes stop_codon:yes gene_type:complete
MPETLKQIYVVEDDPDIQVIVEMALSELGDFDVTVFGDGSALFASLDTTEHPQLIILDVMLPGDDGPTILKKLKARPESAQIPVIFATAKVRSCDQSLYAQLGAIGTIPKPFEIETLCDQVTALWSKQNQG